MTTFQKGDRVRYRSFEGSLYDATVTGIRELTPADTRIELDVDIPGLREPFHMTSVRPERVEPLASPRSAP
jgi:hypothetical protein